MKRRSLLWRFWNWIYIVWVVYCCSGGLVTCLDAALNCRAIELHGNNVQWSNRAFTAVPVVSWRALMLRWTAVLLNCMAITCISAIARLAVYRRFPTLIMSNSYQHFVEGTVQEKVGLLSQYYLTYQHTASLYTPRDIFIWH